MTHNAHDFAAVADLLAYLVRRTGLNLTGARRNDHVASLARVRQAFGIDDGHAFVRRLQGDDDLFQAVVNEITVGETYFLRDPVQLDAIRRTILPALARARPGCAPFKIWSAACATGEEAYSLAIICDQEGLARHADIVGTDISAAAIARARRAEYGTWSLRDRRSVDLARYFQPCGGRYKVIDTLRKRVRFERLNLVSDLYPSAAFGIDQMDLILCRNVLIYLHAQAIEAVAKKLFGSLADGGWLVTGPSDPPLWHHAPFRTVIVPGAVLYQRDEAFAREKPAPFPPQVAVPIASAARPADSRFPLSNVLAKSREKRRQDRGPRPARDAMAMGGYCEEARQAPDARDLAGAEALAADAAAREPLSPDVHFQHGILLVAGERHEEAIAALRRALYLDRSFVAAHLALGTLLSRVGDSALARRSFEAAYRICAAQPSGDPIPHCGHETAGMLAAGARAQINRLRAAARPN